jgi:hypothetical protein
MGIACRFVNRQSGFSMRESGDNRLFQLGIDRNYQG